MPIGSIRTTIEAGSGQTLDLLMRYAGADGLLRHLVHKDWKKRIAADDRLRWLVEK